jgi:cephalosporin hydroxylase
MTKIDIAKVGFWRKLAVRRALRRKEDRLPYNRWNGVRLTKLPTDCFAIHTLFSRCRPQVVIELGSQFGGSAAFIHSFAEAAGIEEILSLDVADLERPNLPKVTWIPGDDTSEVVARRVRDRVGGRSCSVIIDANHHGPHVAKELAIYGEMVTPGQALILEDTHVDVLNFRKFRDGGGPLKAMREWLPHHPDFQLVTDIEPYLTTNFFGYWRREPGITGPNSRPQ